MQLELDEPPLEVQIHEVENDPSFVTKILELTAKMCYGSVGVQFGKGLGFLEFAAKLNSYHEFDIQKWEKSLQAGVMLFL